LCPHGDTESRRQGTQGSRFTRWFEDNPEAFLYLDDPSSSSLTVIPSRAAAKEHATGGVPRDALDPLPEVFASFDAPSFCSLTVIPLRAAAKKEPGTAASCLGLVRIREPSTYLDGSSSFFPTFIPGAATKECREYAILATGG